MNLNLLCYACEYFKGYFTDCVSFEIFLNDEVMLVNFEYRKWIVPKFKPSFYSDFGKGNRVLLFHCDRKFCLLRGTSVVIIMYMCEDICLGWEGIPHIHLNAKWWLRNLPCSVKALFFGVFFFSLFWWVLATFMKVVFSCFW